MNLCQHFFKIKLLLETLYFNNLYKNNPNILDKIPLSKLLKILVSEQISEQVLDSASKCNNITILLTIITNNKLSVAILKRLVQHEFSEIAQAASLHINYVQHIEEKN